MLRADWDLRSGIASAVDDRHPEEMWPPRELSHRSPRQDAHFLDQSASKRDAHLSHVKTLDGVLLQKLFRATVEERMRAAAKVEVSKPKAGARRREDDGRVEAETGYAEVKGFYLPPDLVAQGKTILVKMTAAESKSILNPDFGIAPETAQEPAVAEQDEKAASVTPVQVPAIAKVSKKAAKKAAKRAKVDLEQDEPQLRPVSAPQDAAPKIKKKGNKPGKVTKQESSSEHAEVETRSWIELGESNVPPIDDNAESQKSLEVGHTLSVRHWDERKFDRSASRSSHKEASTHCRDHGDSFAEGEQPQSEAWRSTGGSEKDQSAPSRAEMQARVESEVSHHSTNIVSNHSDDRPASCASRTASKASNKDSSASRQAVKSVRSHTPTNNRDAESEDGWIEVRSDEDGGTESKSRSSVRERAPSHNSAELRQSVNPEANSSVSRSKAESSISKRSSKKEERKSHRSPRHSKHHGPHKDTSLGLEPLAAFSSREGRTSRHSLHRSRKSSRRYDDTELQPEVIGSESSSRRRAHASHHSLRRSHDTAEEQDGDGATEPGAESVGSTKTSDRSHRSSHHSSQRWRTTESLENAYLEQTIAENLAQSEQMSEKHHGSPHQSTHSSRRQSKHSSHQSRRKEQEDDSWHEVDHRKSTRSKSSAADLPPKSSNESPRSHASDRPASRPTTHRSHDSTHDMNRFPERDRTSAASDLYASRRRHASPRESKHSSMTSFGRSFVGVPIYGIVSTPDGHEGIISAPQDSSAERHPEERQHRHRPTVFAGKGWISPHPLSRSPTNLRSPPAPLIILPSQADPQGATMTYEEWQAIQKNGLRKHRNFSFTESSQTWHARQRDERYNFPGWEARSWVEIDPSPEEVEESSSSRSRSGDLEPTVRTIESLEGSRSSGSRAQSWVEVNASPVEAEESASSRSRSDGSEPTVRTIESMEGSQRSGSAASRGQDSRHSTVPYQPKLPAPSQSELLWQEMEEGNGGWS